MLYFSILLLLTSVIIVSGSMSPTERSVFPLIASAENSYNVTVSLEKDDNFELHIYPGPEWKQWVEPPTDYVEYNHKFIFVTITDPEGNYTIVEFTFANEYVGETLYVYGIRVVQYDGTIITEQKRAPPPFAATVHLSGDYTIEVSGAYVPPGGGPPYHIEVNKEEIRTDYPYSSLLPWGATIGILGLIGLVWSAKSGKPQRVRKKATQIIIEQDWFHYLDSCEPTRLSTFLSIKVQNSSSKFS